MLVEISPLGLGRDFYLGVSGIGDGRFAMLLAVGFGLLTVKLFSI